MPAVGFQKDREFDHRHDGIMGPRSMSDSWSGALIRFDYNTYDGLGGCTPKLLSVVSTSVMPMNRDFNAPLGSVDSACDSGTFV